MSDLSLLEGRFLPYRLVPQWLGEKRADALLSYIQAQRGRFRPAKVSEGFDPASRHSLVLKGLGPFDAMFSALASAMQPELETAFGTGRTLPTAPEIEVVAHGDGGFYTPHIDTLTGSDHVAGERRRLTLIYYVHRRPRRFTGGRLRLYDMSGKHALAFEPMHDSLLAFPSFARHEVEKVFCPGGIFADSRFSVNIWLCG
jgi:hypothetical protein